MLYHIANSFNVSGLWDHNSHSPITLKHNDVKQNKPRRFYTIDEVTIFHISPPSVLKQVLFRLIQYLCGISTRSVFIYLNILFIRFNIKHLQARLHASMGTLNIVRYPPHKGSTTKRLEGYYGYKDLEAQRHKHEGSSRYSCLHRAVRVPGSGTDLAVSYHQTTSLIHYRIVARWIVEELSSKT